MSEKSESRFSEQDIAELIDRGAHQPRKEICPERDALSTGNNRQMLMRLVRGDSTLRDEEITSLYEKITTYKSWSDAYIRLRLEHYQKLQADEK